MDQFIDARLLPDPEFTTPMLMSALYNKLHRALVSIEARTIGVSFPEYQLRPRSLGEVLRVHGTQSALSDLLAAGWLNGMMDHITPASIQPAPEPTGHLRVQRKQYKTNVDRLRRRRMKRKGETWDQACAAIPDSTGQSPALPFINLRSQSTGQIFSVFIEQTEANLHVPGEFNTYGLSHSATVPWF